MKLIARKPCRFGGISFYIGDEIPENLVLNPQAMQTIGTLAIVGDEPGAGAAIAAPAHTPVPVEVAPISITVDGSALDLEVTIAGMQSVFEVLCGKVSNAEPVIETMTDGDALILLHAADSRKAVKAAAEARAIALGGDESDGDA